MNKKIHYNKLLDKQIEKLESSDFDLEAWKTGAIYILKMIFGESNPKIGEIDNLKIDYSSWTLRDSSGSYKPVETAKKKGLEIMSIAKDELDILDVEPRISEKQKVLIKLLGEEQLDALQSEHSTVEEKRKILSTLKKEELIKILLAGSY